MRGIRIRCSGNINEYDPMRNSKFFRSAGTDILQIFGLALLVRILESADTTCTKAVFQIWHHIRTTITESTCGTLVFRVYPIANAATGWVEILVVMDLVA